MKLRYGVAIIAAVLYATLWMTWLPQKASPATMPTEQLMVSLVVPVAGTTNLVVQCADIAYAGLAYPQESPRRIVISNGDCDQIEAIVEHRRFPTGTTSLRVLLHEAGHIAQGPIGPWDEHDAECRSLLALGQSLHMLNYDNDWINTAVHSERAMILQEQAPYGGECPAAADRPAEHRTAKKRLRVAYARATSVGLPEPLDYAPRCTSRAGAHSRLTMSVALKPNLDGQRSQPTTREANMPTTSPGHKLFTSEERNAIRKAWRAGKRTITMNDVKFVLSKSKRTSIKRLNKDTSKIDASQGLQYILVRPSDKKRLTPVMQVKLNEKD